MKPSELCNCFAFKQISLKITNIYDKALVTSGLKITQFVILKYIDFLKCTNLNKLSTSMGNNRSTLGRNIKLLERKKLITLNKGNDKREIEITITKNGLKKLNVASKCWQEINKKVTKKLGIKKKIIIDEILYDKKWELM